MHKKIILIIIFTSLVAMGTVGVTQESDTIKITITEPAEDIVTIASKTQVKGVATAVEEGVDVSMVIVEINGVPHKVSVEDDGSFKITADLTIGTNILSAIAIGSDSSITSERRMVIREKEILFQDNFEGDEIKPEWTITSSGHTHWVNSKGVFTIDGGVEDLPMRAYVGEVWWENYIMSVDLRYDSSRHHRPWGRDNQVAFFFRAQDPYNKVGFFLHPGGKSGFRIQKDGVWSDFLQSVEAPKLHNLFITIVVKDNKYTALINNQVLISLENKEDTFTTGYAGLQLARDDSRRAYFDNLKVFAITSKGTAPTLSFLPKTVSSSAWQKGVEKQLSWLAPLTNTLQASLGTTQLGIRQVKSQVSTLEDTVPLISNQVSRLSSSYKEIEDKMEKYEIRLTSQRHNLEGIERDIRKANNLSMMGMIAGIGGIALAGLVALGVLG